MKRPLAYMTAAWGSYDVCDPVEYCRAVFEAGYSPICPVLYLPMIVDNDVPEEHKSGIDIQRDLLRRSHVLVVCGDVIDEQVKNDIAVAKRLNITATTLEGILTVEKQGQIPAYD